MVLVGGLLLSKAVDNASIEQFQDTMKLNSNMKISNSVYNKTIFNNSLNMIFLCIIILVNVIPALLIAYNCTNGTNQKIFNMIIALLFSDLYVLYYTIRKFYYNDKKYC